MDTDWLHFGWLEDRSFNAGTFYYRLSAQLGMDHPRVVAAFRYYSAITRIYSEAYQKFLNDNTVPGPGLLRVEC